MKAFFILILFVILLAILFSKGLRRYVWLMAGILLLNDTVGIRPFNSYTLILTAFFFSMFFHNELKTQWQSFPFKFIFLILLLIHILVVQFDERTFPILTYISRIFNNYVPRFMALFIGYAAISSPQIWKKSAKPMAVIFLVMTIYGFFTFLIQNNPYDDIVNMAFGNELGIWSEVQERGYRVFSTLSNPIVYGYVMFIAATYIYLQQKNIGRVNYIVLLILIILNAFLANSRTGLVAGLLLIAVYALVEYRFSYRIVGFVASITILFAIMYEYIPFVTDAADSVMDLYLTGGEKYNGSTVELKEDQLETSLYYFYMHPYFGNGFHYFQEIIRQQYDTNEIGLAGLEGYGYKLLVEEGIFMIIAVAWLFISMTLFFIRRLSVKKFSAMGIAWIISFLFFIMGTGTYGGIFTIGMLFIGMLLKYVQIQHPVVVSFRKKKKQTKRLIHI